MYQIDAKILNIFWEIFTNELLILKTPHISLLTRTMLCIYSDSLIWKMKKWRFLYIDFRMFISILWFNSSVSFDGFNVFFQTSVPRNFKNSVLNFRFLGSPNSTFLTVAIVAEPQVDWGRLSPPENHLSPP